MRRMRDNPHSAERRAARIEAERRHDNIFGAAEVERQSQRRSAASSSARRRSRAGSSSPSKRSA